MTMPKKRLISGKGADLEGGRRSIETNDVAFAGAYLIGRVAMA
jgi:hypothetical protein